MSSSETTSENKAMDLTTVVAKHYNQLEEKGLQERKASKIFHMRNFNNWIKSMLIGDFLKKVKEGKSEGDKKINVLDIGAGKGGDLLKWKRGSITHLVCADIAETSLQQCEQRYQDMKERDRRQHYNNNSPFTLECIPADCTKVCLKEKYRDPKMQFDLVSCQFSFHYSFESLPQAQCMIQNASECLKPGGFFIGTTPDAFDIVRRLRESESNSFGNNIFSVSFNSKDDNIPLFGAQYDFHLEGVVDCPEFLVYFPAFIELASKAGLKLVFRQRFEDYFNTQIKKDEWKNLLTNMNALQTYMSQEGGSSRDDTTDEKDFLHAEKYIEELKDSDSQEGHRNRWPPRIGTLSKQEWEAVSIYLVFAFVKEERSNVD